MSSYCCCVEFWFCKIVFDYRYLFHHLPACSTSGPSRCFAPVHDLCHWWNIHFLPVTRHRVCTFPAVSLSVPLRAASRINLHGAHLPSCLTANKSLQGTAYSGRERRCFSCLNRPATIRVCAWRPLNSAVRRFTLLLATYLNTPGVRS